MTEAIYYGTLTGHTSEEYSSNQGFLNRGLGLSEAKLSSYLYPWVQQHREGIQIKYSFYLWDWPWGEYAYQMNKGITVPW